MAIKAIKPDSYELRKLYYQQYNSTGTNTSKSFDIKLKLIHNLAFLTFIMRKNKKIGEFESSLSVIDKILGKEVQRDPIWNENQKVWQLSHEDNYYIGLSIIIDDLLWDCDHISIPEGVKDTKDIIDNIKQCFSEYLPF